MHYKNGREAHEGDPVIYKGDYNNIRVGTLHCLTPGSSTCNAQAARVIPGGTTQDYVTIGELYHAEDAFLAINSLPEIKPVEEREPQDPK